MTFQIIHEGFHHKRDKDLIVKLKIILQGIKKNR